MQDTPVPARKPLRARAKPCAADERRRRAAFLAALAATSNVAASARAAGISPARVYEARRRDAAFRHDWQEALCEGYEQLEMALLHRLRAGEVRPARGAGKGVRVFDNATALRLLVAHRDSAARQQAVRRFQDSDAILERINARIDRMREARRIEPGSIEAADPGDD